MASDRDARRLAAAFAWAITAVVVAVLGILPVLAGTASAAPEGPLNGAIPDLTKTPVIPPLGGPIWTATPTPEPTGSVPCAACAPIETPLSTSTPTWTPSPGETESVPTVGPTSQPTIEPGARARLSMGSLIQFGHVQPGSVVIYRHLLANQAGTAVHTDLSVTSLGNWILGIAPGHGTTSSTSPLPITVTVGVPLSPTFMLDVERVDASAEGSASTSAYMITLVGRRPFTDLGYDHWADDYVQYMAANGVVSGYSDGSFRPDDKVSRGQFVKMLVGALGWETTLPARPTFRDVPSSQWAYRYVETAAAHGIIAGYSDGSFRPDDKVSRGQVARMVAAAHGWDHLPLPVLPSFADVQPDSWAYKYVEAAARAGIMAGYSDGTFRPYQLASRAQVAKILTISLFSDPGNQ